MHSHNDQTFLICRNRTPSKELDLQYEMSIQRIGGRSDVNHEYDSPSDEQELEYSYATTADPAYQELDGTQAKPYQNINQVVNHEYDSPSNEQELEYSYATTADPAYQELDGTQAKPYQNINQVVDGVGYND